MPQSDLNLFFRAIDQTQAAVAGVVGGINRAKGAVAGLSQQSLGNIQVFDRHGAAIQGFGKKVQQVSGNIQGLGQSLALGFTVPLVASAAVLTQFDRSAAKLQAGEAFQRTAAQFHQSGDEIVEAMEKASGGTISNLDMMQSASRSMILGVAEDSEEFTRLMEIARDRARVFGLSTTQAFNDLTLGIGRQSRLILDNLGIIVRIEDANKNYAESLGKTVRDLTDAEKRQGFLNAVLEQGEATLDRTALATRNASEEYLHQRASLDNLINSVQQSFLPVISIILRGFNALPPAVASVMVAMVGLLLVAGPLFSAFGALGGMLARNLIFMGRISAAYRAQILVQNALTASMIAGSRAGYTNTIIAQQSVIKSQGLLGGSLGILIAKMGLLRLTLIAAAAVTAGLFVKGILQGKSAADSFVNAINTITLGLGKRIPVIGEIFKTTADKINEEEKRITQAFERLRKESAAQLDGIQRKLEEIEATSFSPDTARFELFVDLIASRSQELGGELGGWEALVDFIKQIAAFMPPDQLLRFLDALTAEFGEMSPVVNAAMIALSDVGVEFSEVEEATRDAAKEIAEFLTSLKNLFAVQTAAKGFAGFLQGIETQEELELQLQLTNNDILEQNRIIELGGRTSVQAAEEFVSAEEKKRDALGLTIQAIDIQIRELELLQRQSVPQSLLDEITVLEQANSARQRRLNALNREITAIERLARAAERQLRPDIHRVSVIDREIRAIERKARAMERANRPLERQVRLLSLQARAIEIASRPARRELERLQKIPGLSQDVIRAQQAIVDAYDAQIDTLTDSQDLLQLELDIRQSQIDLIRDQTDALQDERDALQDSIDARQDHIDEIRATADQLRNEADEILDNITATSDLIDEKRDYIDSLKDPALQKEIDRLKAAKDLLQLQRDKLNLLVATMDAAKPKLASGLDPYIRDLREGRSLIQAQISRIDLLKRKLALEYRLKVGAPRLERIVLLLAAAAKGAAVFRGVLNYLQGNRPGLRGMTPETLTRAVASLFGIPLLQHGGIVTKPTFSLLGEAGPEAVIPLSRGLPAGLAAPNITIIIEGNADEDVVDEIVAKVRKLMR